MHTTIILAVYAVIILVGGIFGYVKAKSNASLMTSIPAAIIVGIAAYLTHQGQVLSGLTIGAVVSGLMTLVFIMRYAKTKNAMPAIPMIVISVFVLGACIHRLMHVTHSAG